MRLRPWLALAAVSLAVGGAGAACSSTSSPVSPQDAGGGGTLGGDATNGVDTGSDADAAGLSTVHFVGRVDKSNPAAVRFSWSGTQIRARFSGTGATLRLQDTGGNLFDVSVDGAAPSLLTTNGTNSYVVASGLPDASHDLVVTKRTEASVGVVSFLGITSAENRPLVPTPDPSLRRIEVIGDSITCGYGVLGPDGNCSFSPTTEDEDVAYGALAAVALQAEHTAIAYSGIGIYRNASGSTTDQMPTLFSRALADDAASTWDFSYVPDVVIVNLGTNDFATGDPGAPFQTGYVSFLQTLRTKYPNAPIVATLSPMLTDTFPVGELRRTKAKGYIQAAVTARNTAGDAKVTFLEFDEQLASDGYGCDFHPSQATHQKMSDKLAAALRSLMSW